MESEAPDELLTELAELDIPADVGTYTVAVRGGGAALTIPMDSPPVFVGQSPVCALHLEDPRVSRRHLSLQATPGGLRVTDLESTNGVRIGGVRVLEALLAGGELIEIGGTVLEVGRGSSSRESTTPSHATEFGRVVGTSPVMRSLYAFMQKLADTSVPVLIEGETGTGKEVLAEALHEASSRADRPFVVFDCTSVPPNLVESELLGHERGAYTGAVATRPGVFEQADGGTLLIDEIGDLDLAVQPKLLRVLERLEVKRVGGSKVTPVDVRVLAATRRDLDQEVQSGRFRDDLFHRLAIARIELPPLRQRRGDIPVLVRHFAKQLCGKENAVPYEQVSKWESRSWPGNIRELRNAVVRFIALGAEGEANYSRQPSPTTRTFEASLDLPIGIARQRLVDEFERAYVAHVLARHGGDIRKAVAASGIARRQFFRLKARSGTRPE